MLDTNWQEVPNYAPAHAAAAQRIRRPHIKERIVDRICRIEKGVAPLGTRRGVASARETADRMTPTSPPLPWIEIAAAIVIGGILLLLIAGLILLRTTGRRGPRWSLTSLWNRAEALTYGARMLVEVDDLKPQQALSFQAVVQRGWSPELARSVLGRPDYAVLDPQRKRDPLFLFDRVRVERAENRKKFRAHQARMANEQARSEARIRKWVELRQLDAEPPEPARHDV